MKKVALMAAEKYGVEFLYRDFRPRFYEGQNEARELGLYMQNYCGCIFSEEERFKKHKKQDNK
jgi:predicted adenine nucleotide alpha hydrolase (AANH) superfamily ATPase